MNDITSVVETQLGNRTHSRLHGVEYSGACPWCGGTDRFHVWPDENFIPGIGCLGLFQCMGESAGRAGCSRCGDMVKYIEMRRGVPFLDACHILDIDAKTLLDYRRGQNGDASEPAPARPILQARADTSMIWEQRADTIAVLAHRCLLSEKGLPGLAYLRGRGLSNDIIASAELGYCAKYVREDAKKWGYQDGKTILLRGIVIPWRDANGRVVCIRFRRLPEDTGATAKMCYGVDGKTGQVNRYKAILGSSAQHLYRGGTVQPEGNAVLLEGELDALAVAQSLGEKAAVVATGSTSWGRSAVSRERLLACGKVLVCYDADAAGDKASKYWLGELPNARRWRPLWNDANDMLSRGVDLTAWITVGLEPKGQDDDLSTVCCICGRAVEYYDPDAVAYCEKHWQERQVAV